MRSSLGGPHKFHHAKFENEMRYKDAKAARRKAVWIMMNLLLAAQWLLITAEDMKRISRRSPRKGYKPPVVF